MNTFLPESQLSKHQVCTDSQTDLHDAGIEDPLRKVFALAGTDTPVLANQVCILILHLLRSEEIDNAIRVAREANIRRRFENVATVSFAAASAPFRIRLAFIDHVLLGGSNHDEHLASVIETAGKPVVASALSPCIHVLNRKAEYPAISSIERRAVQCIAGMLLREHALYPRISNSIAVARWMALARRNNEAIDVVRRLYNDPDYSGGFAALAVAFWAATSDSLAVEALSMERLRETNDPMTIFTRTVAHALTGQTNEAAHMLRKLHSVSPSFFCASCGPTFWGMSSLLFKAMGLTTIAESFLPLAAQTDPYHRFRRHFWDRVPQTTPPIILPTFSLPATQQHPAKHAQDIA